MALLRLKIPSIGTISPKLNFACLIAECLSLFQPLPVPGAKEQFSASSISSLLGFGRIVMSHGFYSYSSIAPHRRPLPLDLPPQPLPLPVMSCTSLRLRLNVPPRNFPMPGPPTPLSRRASSFLLLDGRSSTIPFSFASRRRSLSLRCAFATIPLRCDMGMLFCSNMLLLAPSFCIRSSAATRRFRPIGPCDASPESR